MKAKWFKGIPPAKAVLAHESEHARPDGIRLGRVIVGQSEVTADDWMMGEWICNHVRSRIQPWVSIVRLKVVNGEVIVAIGFTTWEKLSDCRWGPECEYYPVGQNGLPL